jgi:hypothetical protein
MPLYLPLGGVSSEEPKDMTTEELARKVFPKKVFDQLNFESVKIFLASDVTKLTGESPVIPDLIGDPEYLE